MDIKTLKKLQKSKRYLVECLDCESEFESQKLKRDVLGMFIFPKCHLCTIGTVVEKQFRLEWSID